MANGDEDDEDVDELQKELDEILAEADDMDAGDIGDADADEADEDKDEDDADADREAADEALLEELENLPAVGVALGELRRGQLALEKVSTMMSSMPH